MSVEQPVEGVVSEIVVERAVGVARPRIEVARSTWSALDLMRHAKENPPEPLIEGLLYAHDILLVHAPEESFKSMFIVQIAESMSQGNALLRKWRCHRGRRVGIIETEMHPAMMGKRLLKMFPDGKAPENLVFMSEDLLHEWRRKDLKGKFDIIAKWIAEEQIRVLLIDTANDFFRGSENPSDERSVGEFFDRLRNLELDACILVRHDRKKKDIDADSHSNELIRGSAEWKEDPEAILHLKRIDKRTNQVLLEVGKLRYAAKPEPFQAWFDAGCFRLTPLPPVIAVLETGEKGRQEIIAECKRRFGIEQRTTDEMIGFLKQYLIEEQHGHGVNFRLHPDRSLDAEWAEYLTLPAA
jgi:hypothetical protein